MLQQKAIKARVTEIGNSSELETFKNKIILCFFSLSWPPETWDDINNVMQEKEKTSVCGNAGHNLNL